MTGSDAIEVVPQAKRWTITPDSCVSGQRHGFFGVDLSQGDDALVRVLYDPEG